MCIRDRGETGGREAALQWVTQFGAGLDPKVIDEIFKKFFGGVVSNPNLLPKVTPGPAEGLSPKQILNRLSGFDEQKTKAELRKSDTALLAALEAEQDFINQQLSRKSVQRNDALRRSLQGALLEVQNDIEQLAEDRKQDAEDAADKIKEANQAAAKNLIAVFSGQEQKRLNQETLAAETEGLKDDLAADKDLLRLYLRQRRLGIKKIKDKEALRDFLKDINQKIFDVTLEIKNDRKALNQQLRQQQREQREKVISGLELDIEFASITENTQREIALRRKLIKALEDQIKHEKGNKLKIKELRNEIARQKQAIKDLQKETEDRNDSFKQFLFESLQAEAGFAANLLNNVVPIGALAGTVGQTLGSTTGAALERIGGAAATGVGNLGVTEFSGGFRPFRESGGPDGRGKTSLAIGDSKAGPTKGGQNREISLLVEIRNLLKKIQSGEANPESNRHRRTQNSSLDGAGTFIGGV